MSKVILFCPVREPDAAFEEAVASHRLLHGLQERWYFDDARQMILCPTWGCSPERFVHIDVERAEEYKRTEHSHQWTPELMSRIGKIRNAALERFKQTDADFLFIVDADIILHPDIVNHLVSLNLPIVSEVFWTQWQPGDAWLPNVWDFHNYGFSNVDGFHSGMERVIRLKNPGTYEVGGLGAITLIRRDVIEAGVNFSGINGLQQFPGEDRHFCTRAAVHGFTLHADTYFPGFHMYRPSQLEEAKCWRAMGCPPEYFAETWLTEQWEACLRAGPPQPKRIALCCPGQAYSSGWVSQWTNTLANLWTEFVCIPTFGYSSDASVTRQGLSIEVLKQEPEPDYVLWIDDDNLINHEQVKKLIGHLEANFDAAISAAWCWCQPDGAPEPVGISCGWLTEEMHTHPISEEDLLRDDQPIDVDYTGFPALVMRFSVLKQLGPRAFVPILSDKFTWGKSGEDVAFCFRLKQAGYRILVDPTIQIPHLKVLPAGKVLDRQNSPVRAKSERTN